MGSNDTVDCRACAAYALIWTGADPKQTQEHRFAYMLQPVVQTLANGFKVVAINHTVRVAGGRNYTRLVDKTQHLRRGDVFVWVGNYGMLVRGVVSIRSELALLSARGAHLTV